MLIKLYLHVKSMLFIISEIVCKHDNNIETKPKGPETGNLTKTEMSRENWVLFVKTVSINSQKLHLQGKQ